MFRLYFFLVISTFWALPSFALKSYITLFAQTEIAISSLGHEGYQNLLKSSNQKDLKELDNWIASRGISRTTSVDDYWLIRGARLDLDPKDASDLAKEPWVSSVLEDRERRFIVPASADTGFEQTPVPMPWGLKQIGLDRIRAEYPDLRGKGVKVGILDTGIQSHHPEFRRVSAQGDLSYSDVLFKDFVAKLKLPFDDHGHGTHVAGTIAGENVGVAPDASLVVAKVFAPNGSSTDAVLIEAMQWIFDPDGDPKTNDFPRIVSNSWSATIGPGVNEIAQFAPYRLALQTWVNGGVIPVFAAGNSGLAPNGVPAGLPEAIAVGAIDYSGAIAPFSSRGPNLWDMGSWVLTVAKPDISAPGADVMAPIPNNTYATWSGTSMATPHVAGSLALMLQANHKLSVADAKRLLLESSHKKFDAIYGYGVLDAYQLIRLAKGAR